MTTLPTSGVFQCPKCFQKYTVQALPNVVIRPYAIVRRHMRNTHGQTVDARWVRRRLKEK